MLQEDVQTPWALYEQAQWMYPSPPDSSDDLDTSALDYPVQLGLVYPPTPMLDHEYLSPSHLIGEEMTQTSEGVEEQVITVSTFFHPGSHIQESDLILCSTDAIHFYVHADFLNRASQATLPAFLSYSIPGLEGGIIPIPETGRILNIILHAIYGTNVSRNSPTTQDLLEAIDKLPKYGLIPRDLIRPNTDLFTLLLTHAALQPLAIYAAAGYHDIFELAQQASTHLLAFRLNEIDDQVATRMGPAYLKRLFLLHLQRMDTAKEVLLQPPTFHPATEKCSFDDQKRVKRAWALGTTYLAWEMRADLSGQSIKNVFDPMIADMECAGCKGVLNKRVRDVLVAWSSVKCTI